MSSFIYFIKESLQGFTRNFSTAFGSIITIFLSLMIIGVFLVGGSIINTLVSSIENEVTITAYVADNATQNNINQMMDRIRSMEGVQNVSFTTKEQALINFQGTMANPEIIEQLDGENPLPASIDIELSDPQMVETVANEIIETTLYRSITDNPSDPGEAVKYGQQTVDRLFTLTNYVRYIGFALIIILIFIALVFINNTIRLAILARRREISIMRLVGASNGFIRGPFLMEGAIHALIGSLLAVLVIQLLRSFALPQIQGALSFLNLDVPNGTYLLIYLALVVAGLVIGLIGSAFAMRRYLKV